MKKRDFCKNHPELREGEVFLANADDDHVHYGPHPHEIGDLKSSYESIVWKSKRRGEIAYDTNNNVIPDMFPVFVKRTELIRGGIDPDKLW